jgi:predicted HAD superfamily Cof-like phosphohydrolase
MSTEWANDINVMHEHFGVHDVVDKFDEEMLGKFIKFRAGCVQEEVGEFQVALVERDPEEMVDALIDVCVFAIGTLDLLGVDANAAWDSVYKANMNKNVGIKEGRPNPFGLPDLIKPEDWTPPSHEGNHGKFDQI